MNNVTENNEEKSIEVFTGTDWECGLVQSLLENAEINAFVYYGGRGTLAPWNLVGSVPKKWIAVSREDYEKAKQVVEQYYEAMKEWTNKPFCDFLFFISCIFTLSQNGYEKDYR